jgi:hypothetical protein
MSAAATGRRLKRHTRPPEINLAEYRIRSEQVLSGFTHECQIAA